MPATQSAGFATRSRKRELALGGLGSARCALPRRLRASAQRGLTPAALSGGVEPCVGVERVGQFGGSRGLMRAERFSQ